MSRLEKAIFQSAVRKEDLLYFRFYAKFTNVPLAMLANRCGISANGVTLIAALLCIPAALLNCLGFFYSAILVFHLFFVLDCVDGVLARATRTTSPRGGYLDDYAHAIFHTVFLLTAGIGNLRSGNSWLGLLLVAAALTTNLLRWHEDLRQKFFPTQAAPVVDAGILRNALLKDLIIGSFQFPNVLLWLTALGWQKQLLTIYLAYVVSANLAYNFYTAYRVLQCPSR